MESLRQLVEQYTSLGLVTIPVSGKRPVSVVLDENGQPLRRPDGSLVRWQAFIERPPSDVELEAFEWERATGLAVVLGPGSWQVWRYLWTLDIEHEFRSEAEQWLDQHVPQWRGGVVAETGSGGLHVYFLASHPVTTGVVRWGEVRGQGALCILPPSRHPETGRTYRWLSERWTNLPQLEPTAVPGYGGRAENGRQGEPLDVGRALAGVPLGQRNQALFRLSCRLRASGVPLEWATRLVTEAAANCSPPWGLGPDEESPEKLVERVYRRYQPNPELVVGVSASKFDSPIYKSCVGESNLTGSSGEQFDSPIIEKTVGESNLTFRTPDQLLAYTPSDTPWLWRGFLVKQTVTLLAGRPKVGKSTLVFALLAALERGEPFLGQATIPTKAVVLTEERAATLAAKLRKYPLTSCEFLLRDECRLPWPLVVEAAVQRAKETGAELLVVDTVAAWAQLAADEENQAGAVLAAMAPVLRAASEGLSVLVVTHERKAGAGDPVTAVRGSSALTGVVDIVVEVTTGPANLPASARVIRAVGRFDETPGELVIDDGYQVLGSMTEATAAYERERILQCLASDDGMTADEVAEALDLPRATALRRLKELHEAGQVVRSGQGRKGDPYVWYLTKGEYSLSAESYSPVADSIRPRDSLIWANRIPGESESSERDPARQGCLLETEARSPTADSICPRNTYRWANGIGDEAEPNGRHSPGDSSQPTLVEQGAPDGGIAWGEWLLGELRAGRVQLPVVELKPGHTVLDAERFLVSHVTEAKLGIGAALENLRLYRKALEQFGIGTGSG
jgi:DNA-binding transcriptional ArsR family regulator